MWNKLQIAYKTSKTIQQRVIHLNKSISGDNRHFGLTLCIHFCMFLSTVVQHFIRNPPRSVSPISSDSPLLTHAHPYNHLLMHAAAARRGLHI